VQTPFLRLSALAGMLLLLTLDVMAQGLPAGQWRYHSYFGRDSILALSPKMVYASYGNAILTYDRLTGDLGNIDKTDGITDVNVTALAHAYDRELLAIGYRSGSIDLVEGNKVTTIDGLSRATLSVSKAIVGIDIIGNRAYVYGAFGFLAVDLDKREIRFSNTSLDQSGNNQPVAVNAVCQSGTILFLSTSRGIYSIPANQNLQDSRLYSITSLGSRGLPANGGVLRGVATSNGFVYATLSLAGVFYKKEGESQWKNLKGGVTSSPFRSLKGVKDRLLLCAGGEIYAVRDSIATQAADSVGEVGAGAPKVALQDKDNEIWVADLGSGLLKVSGPNAEGYQTGSPGFPLVFSLYGYKDKMLAMPGGFSPDLLGQLENTNGVGVFQNNFWTGLNQGKEISLDVRDICGAAYDKRTEAVYFNCWGSGLAVVPEDRSKPPYMINDSTRKRDGNTLFNLFPLQPRKFIRIGGVAFDRNGNLYAGNFSDTVLHLRDQTDTWYKYSAFEYENRANTVKMAVDDQFIKYMVMGRPRENNSVLLRSPDNRTWSTISKVEGKGGLPNVDVRDLVIDKDGAVWLATAAGIAVLYNPISAFGTQPYNVSLPIFDGRPLLENDVCTAIMLDGGGRKWVGTRASGVWVFDKDVTKVLANFTAENSPLPSNNITDLAIVPKTGEVFVATDNSLVSYNSAATFADESEASNSCVRIYPSPVRPGYTGNIAIDCLPENAVVKITDAGGRLVFEGVASGGGIIWNGQDYTGRRPRPGVYIVYAFAPTSGEKIVGRFAIVD
jgi:hypothetical protein